MLEARASETNALEDWAGKRGRGAAQCWRHARGLGGLGGEAGRGERGGRVCGGTHGVPHHARGVAGHVDGEEHGDRRVVAPRAAALACEERDYTGLHALSF